MAARKEKSLRAVAYARFSSEMQREESIDAQLHAIETYAENNHLLLCGSYIDRAKSATTDQRPEFQRMIVDAQRGQFDVVIVHKLDRFSRDRYDSAFYKRKLRLANVALHSVLENLDGSPESVILESVIEGFNEYYSRNLAREVEKGKKENARKGIHVGGVPPLGYDVDPQTRKLVINEREAEAVRLIFAMSREGLGHTQMRDRLNSGGYTTKRGRPFGKNSIHEILRNEKYTGVYIYNRSVAKSVDGKFNRHALKDESEIIRLEGAVPQIIDKETFQRVQETFRRRRHKGARHKAKEPYLLTGKIVCGKCGSAYVGNHRKAYAGHVGYTSYRCGRKNNAIRCDSKEIRKEDIERTVLRVLSERLFNDKLLPRLEKEYADFLCKQGGADAQEYERLQKRHGELSVQIENIVGVIAQTGSAALTDKLRELEQQRAQVEHDLSGIESRRREQTLVGKQLADAFHRAKAMLAQGTLESCREVVNTYVERVTVFDDHISIKLHLSESFGLEETRARSG
ncbi:recombinase family protein [Agathobaculum sp.]|uniref:recombinase family protein n=1 Tax=Agathobaculum sp. TaxID=2048138 RepID=UPI002A835B6C|nr:recombinase family protein [Agathobaculum sp.]MDY3617777.1 recombinase family protein [Agathobaculum sp.]